MHVLATRYGQIQSIPARATVVFVAQLSPRIECTQQLILGFLRDADIVKRRIRAKSRFEKYYTQDTFLRGDRMSAKNLGASSRVADHTIASLALVRRGGSPRDDIMLYESYPLNAATSAPPARQATIRQRVQSHRPSPIAPTPSCRCPRPPPCR